MRIIIALILNVLLISVLSGQGSQASGSISGKIADSTEALTGASVFVAGSSTLGTTSNNSGQFSLSGIPAGKHTIEITYIGYEKLSREVVIEAGKNIDLGRLVLALSAKGVKEVTVEGKLKSGSEIQAITLTKNADQIITVLSSETIKKLPDKNAADALKRLAGVTIQNVKGEGGYVSLRGTPTDWTSTLINGDRLPVADEENTSRSFEFEVLPSDLIDRIDVTRTVTPDLEGDNIGGSINFILKEPVDKRTFLVNAAVGYDFLSQKPTGNINALWGDVSKNKKFSYVLNVSLRDREYAVDAFKIIYGNNFNHAINRFELKDYFGNRMNFGFNGGFDYKVSTRAKVGFKAMCGLMQDDKSQNRLDFTYSSGDGMTIQPNYIHGILNRQLFGGELNTKLNPTEKWSILLRYSGTYNRFFYGPNPYTNNPSDPRNGYFMATFNNVVADFNYFDTDPILQNGQRYNPSAPQNPNNPLWNAYTKLLDIDNPYNPNNVNNPYNPKSPLYNPALGPDPYLSAGPAYNPFNDPNNPLYAQNATYVHGNHYTNIQPVFNNKLNDSTVSFLQASSETNYTYEADPAVVEIDNKYKVNENVTIKFGAKARYKMGARNLSYTWWTQNFANGQNTKFYYLYDFQTTPNRWGNFLSELGSPYSNITIPNMSQAGLSNILQNLGATPIEHYMDKYNELYPLWVGASYDYQEAQAGGYGMVEAKVNKWYLVGGLRLEYTHLYEHALGMNFDPSAQIVGVDPRDGNTYAYQPTFDAYTRLQYLAWLPSLNTTYRINNRMNWRMAVSRTFHRQNFMETKPGAALIKYQDFLYIQGNPNLKPTYSYNLDLSYQFFWGKSGLITVSAYGKYIYDHIFVTTTGSYDPLTYFVEKSFRNADNSWVAGAEAEFKKQFDFLPKFLSGLGLNANVTYSYSRMHVPGRPASQAMSEQSPLLYNVGIYYEKYGFKANLALNYNSPYLMELNLATLPNDPNGPLLHPNSAFDVFMGEQYALDLQVSYEFKKHFTVYFEGNNLLDWQYKEYVGDPNRPLRVEYYKQRIQVGFKYEL